MSYTLIGKSIRKVKKFEGIFMTLSERLTGLVEKRFNGNWNEFARNCDLRPSTVQRIKEGNDPRIDTVLRIAKALNVSVDWLLGNNVEETEKDMKNQLLDNFETFLKDLDLMKSRIQKLEQEVRNCCK